MNHSELVESKKSREDKPSSKDINNLESAKLRQDKLDKQKAEFLSNGGKVQEVEFGVMNTENKGTTALRINHERNQEKLK